MFTLFNGRIAGISGILDGLLRPALGDLGWRVAFVAGLIGAPVLYRTLCALPEIQLDAGWTFPCSNGAENKNTAGQAPQRSQSNRVRRAAFTKRLTLPADSATNSVNC
jgi:uncharacterized membrane protein YedE/YeeE